VTLQNFSPAAQRIIALGLAMLALVALFLIVVPFLSVLADDLGRINAQRSQLARAEAIAAMPAPRTGRVPDPTPSIQGASSGAAAEQLSGYLAQLAARRSVTIENHPAAVTAAKSPSLLSLSIKVSGEQSAVIAFIGDVEAGKPLIRFQRLIVSRLVTPRAPPMAGPSAIMSQSPNADIATGAQPSVLGPGDAAMTNADTSTTLEANGTVLTLWGGAR
jgi:hypothetical protein